MKYSLGQNSAPGTRQSNQDRLGYAERKNAVFMVLADGLGGYDGGEMAAETLVDSMIEAFERVKDRKIGDPWAFLVLSIMHSHSMIHRRAQHYGLDPDVPRTTCVACLVQDGYAYWGHIGDSRLYHFRGEELLTRTMDHTTSEQFREDGLITEHDMRKPGWQGQLMKCVGGAMRPLVTLGHETRLETDDVILLCSDGIWKAFDSNDLIEHLEYDPLDDALEEMLTHAEGKMIRDCDNISAIALRWEDKPTSARPLEALVPNTVDQEELWKLATKKKSQQSKDEDSAPSTTPPTDTKSQAGDIEATLAELESFVNHIERIL